MGKKVNPYSFRIGISTPWKSKWYATGLEYITNLHQDLKVKKLIHSCLNDAGVADIEIERAAGRIVINIKTSKPGVVIGRQGASLTELKNKIVVLLQSKDIDLKVEEIRKPEVIASLVASSIARQIEKRMPYRRACKQALEKAMEMGVLGCKIRVSGRLNGVEIARTEVFIDGRIPLQTLRAEIDYFNDECQTAYGKIGVKVWIYKGDVFADKKKMKAVRREEGELKEKIKEAVEENVSEAPKDDQSVIDISYGV